MHTLKRMRRNTNQVEFRELMQAARSKIPDVRITSDVIVGFPGETEEEWQISKAFIQEMDFDGFMHFATVFVKALLLQRKCAVKSKKPSRKPVFMNYWTWASSAGNEIRGALYIGQALPVLWEQVSGSSDAGYSKQVIRTITSVYKPFIPVF